MPHEFPEATQRRIRPALQLPHLSRSSNDPTQQTLTHATAPYENTHSVSNAYDIDRINLNGIIYQGALSKLNQHRKDHHPNQEVFIINAYAKNNPHPLGVPTSEQIIKHNQKCITKGKVKKTKASDTCQHDNTQNNNVLVEHFLLQLPYENVQIAQESLADSCKPHDHRNSFIANLVNIYIDDTVDSPIELIFNFTSSMIHHAVTKNIPVYIACQAGISRSSTITIAYMKQQCGFSTTDSAWKHLCQSRPQAAPNLGFKCKLDDYSPQKELTGQFTPVGIREIIKVDTPTSIPPPLDEKPTTGVSPSAG